MKKKQRVREKVVIKQMKCFVCVDVICCVYVGVVCVRANMMRLSVSLNKKKTKSQHNCFVWLSVTVGNGTRYKENYTIPRNGIVYGIFWKFVLVFPEHTVYFHLHITMFIECFPPRKAQQTFGRYLCITSYCQLLNRLIQYIQTPTDRLTATHKKKKL